MNKKSHVYRKAGEGTRILVRVAAATVLIMGATAISIPMPLGGYIHLGDAVIFLACAFLSWWAVPAAALGSAFADIFLGYTIFAPATFVIKGIMAVIAVLLMGNSKKPARWLLAFVVSSIFMQLGYAAYQYGMAFLGLDQDSLALIYSGWYVVMTNFLLGCLQSVVAIPTALFALNYLFKIEFLHIFKKPKKLLEDDNEADNTR